MEYILAPKVDFDKSKIIYNNPGKGEWPEECLLSGGKLHVDNNNLEKVVSVAEKTLISNSLEKSQ